MNSKTINKIWSPRWVGCAGIVLLAALLVPVQCQAQTLYGSIVGKVTDQTGASIPGADVSIINQETNFTRQGITDDVGNYSFPAVPTGSFTVKVSMPGFKEYVETDVPVTVNRLARVDVTLEIGEVTETLTVTSETAILQSDTAEVRAEMTEEKFVNLPVPLGRNYQWLLKTLPGVAPPRRTHSIQTNPSRSLKFNVNGVSESINNTRIEGVTSINPQLPHITGYVPSLESIQTVNVVSNSFDAEQGLAGGAAISVQLRSGTNDFHGSLFEYHHNQHLRARNFFLPENKAKGKYVYNQWGATAGGPIKKDKLFFFASYEGTADYKNAERIRSVPTLPVRGGDFSGFKRKIYDPLTGNPDGSGREQFPNNIIPSQRIDPISQKVIDLIPPPNLKQRADGTFPEKNNFFATGSAWFDRWTIDSKIDWNVTDEFNMFGRFSVLDYANAQPTVFGEKLVGDALKEFAGDGGNPGTGSGNSYNLSLGANYVFSPTFILDANYGFARFITDSRNPNYGENVGLDFLGIPGTNGPEVFQGGFPNFELSGYHDYGNQQSYMPYYRRDEQFQYVANFTWTKGTHELRWGVDFNRQDMNQTQPQFSFGPGMGPFGRFDFSKSITRLCTKPDGSGGCKKLSKSDSRGNSFAAFLLGLPSRLGKNLLVEHPFTTRNWLRSFYIRDRWQATPKLTFSYGTRWEYYPFPTRKDRGVELYDVETNKALICGVGSVPKDCGIEVSKKLFAPRIGLAYRATNSFVIRAGYGITNDPFPLARPLRTNYPLIIVLVREGANSWNPAGRLADGIPEIQVPSHGDGIIDIPGDIASRGVPNPFPRGYVQSWNLMLQKELKGGFVGEVGYVSTRSIRQLGFRRLNYADIGTGRDGRQLVKKFGRTADTRIPTPLGGAQYDALQARLQRRFVDGFSLDAAYTWSKGIADSSFEDSDSTLRVNIPEFFHLNRGLFDEDRAHNLQISSILELPFGGGQRWLSDRGFLSKLVGGWQVNSILSFYTGRPFRIDAPGGDLNAPGNSQRADQVKPNVEKLGGIGDGQPYYDPTAFAEVEEARFGTSGLNILRRPGVANWDFGLFRDFRVSEDVSIQFRMESFNFTNTPHFGGPDNDVDDSSFMEIDSATDDREFRFGLRINF